MIRLVIVVLFSFFFGVLVSFIKDLVERGKGDFSTTNLLPILGALAFELLLLVTCPAQRRLHLFAAAVTFGCFGFLMSHEEVFVSGVGKCSPLTFGVASLALALVVTYGRSKESKADREKTPPQPPRQPQQPSEPSPSNAV
jgi:hypothetical protein